MSGDVMQFPNSVEDFMEKYKIVDTEHVYTNGTELVPIFRMKQWFEHIGAEPIRHGKLIYEATIELEPKTKKNNSRIIRVGGGRRIIPSKEFEAYQKGAGFYLGFPEGLEAINERVNLECKFYRSTKRRVDLVNLEQAICDILVHYGVLADDSFNIIARMDGSEVLIDKERPRTEVKIYRLEENEDVEKSI